MNKLPKESSSQEIGRLAGRAMVSNLPTSWIETPLSGDTDFGIDYQVQLKNSHGNVCYTFFLQLKGTEKPSYISNGEFISFNFKTSTLAYYHKQEPLVMVALVDLSVHSDDLSKCPIYYMWLDEDWFNLNNEKMHSQSYLALNIPTTQKLNSKLDIFPFYEERILEKFAVQSFRKALKPHSEDISRSIVKLAGYIEDKPVLIKIVEDSDDEPWISNPNGEAVTLLKQCSDALNDNLIIKAQEILSQLDSWPNKLSDHENAELMLQKSILCELLGIESESLKMVESAKDHSDKTRYKLAFLDAKIKNGQLLTQGDIESIESEITQGNFRATFIKAKHIAISGELKDAISLIEEKHSEKISAKLLLLTLAETPDELDLELKKINPSMLNTDRDKYIFHAITSRRNFFKAHNDIFDYDQLIPFTGKANIDFDFMKLSYENCDRAWFYAKKLGYPSDILMIIDISPVLYFYFNNIEYLFQKFDEILKERPTHYDLNLLYSRVLYNCNEYKRVVSLLSRIEHALKLEEKAIYFASNVYLEEYDIALNVFLDIENELLEKTPENTPFVLCLAIEVAIAKFEDSLADRLKTILLNFENGEAFWAVSTCVREVRVEPGAKSECLEKLYHKYIDLGKPIVIADHLMRFLNVSNEKSEDKIIEVAEEILTHKELDEVCSLKLAEAYLKRGDTGQVFSIVDKNLKKINTDPHWHVIKTYALEQSGRVGEALDEIEKALEGNNYSTDYMRLYVSKCLSFGMFSQVEGVLQRLLSSEHLRKNKLVYLSKLITVYSSSLEYREKLNGSIKRFGELVDRNDCDEEGRYLSFAMSASVNVTNEMKSDYSKRITDYFNKFPKSNLFRKADIDINSGPEALLNSIREITGVTEAQITQWDQNKRSIRKGSLPVPFSMLGLFLSDTRDIYTSWMLAKNTPDEFLEFKINQAPQSSQEIIDISQDLSANFLIEETTLILMQELNILENFLGSIQRFTILNSCFERMNVTGLPSLLGVLNPLPKGILDTISNHRAKLRIENDGKENLLESYRKLKSKDGEGFIFLTEDAYMSMFCGSNDEFKSMWNIYDVILSLHDSNKIGDNNPYELIAQVSTYGFKSINMKTDLMAQVMCYFYNKNEDYTKTNFKYIFDKVFNPRLKFDNVIGVLFRLVGYAIDEDRIKFNSRIMLNLFTNFLLRYPQDSKVNFILNWFLYQCTNGKESYISDLLPMSVTHATLWNVCYEMCCIVMDRELNSRELFMKISNYILDQKPDVRDGIYNNVTKCFIPGTADYDSFSQTYKSISLGRQTQNFDKNR
ncbi:DUF4365 domain-containing protein [Pantoea agglomerans]|uniref:DUF4365 domain-containing protein n=1 Tax=Enterobacter agglomerans TaxID=549 RepID=UPI003208CF68